MNKKVIIAIVVMVIVIIAGLMLVSTNDSNVNVDNTTNLESLKASGKTSEAFDSIELGDSKEEVTQKIGELSEVGESSEGYDTYSYTDSELASTYYFFFDGDKLKEVSVMYE